MQNAVVEIKYSTMAIVLLVVQQVAREWFKFPNCLDDGSDKWDGVPIRTMGSTNCYDDKLMMIE